MTRPARHNLPAGKYHCINRGVERREIFLDDEDYQSFITSMDHWSRIFGIKVPAFCLMPNHWHIVIDCEKSEQMSNFFRRLLGAHTYRHRTKYQTTGQGPLYQGRFQAIPILDERGFSTTCQYVENNPVRSKLVSHPSNWMWSSAGKCQTQIELGLALVPDPFFDLNL